MKQSSKHGILHPDQNQLVALPTGTGKTLLGELALLSSLGQEPGLVCYIAPYVALGRQVYEKINRHTPPEIRVHQMVGGYKEPDSLEPERQAEVVVATPERFDALLRSNPELLPSVQCVVFDEAHMVGNDQRGIRLEGIITRLRLAKLRDGSSPRFVLLSAVLSNANSLGNWIGIGPDDVISGTWRPSAKRLLRWTEDGVLKMHAGDDPLRDEPDEVLGETLLPWPRTGFYRAANIGGIKKQEPATMENLAVLADYEHSQYHQPVLCVCSTRPKTRQLAREIARRFTPLQPIPQSIGTVIELINQKYLYLRPLKEALQRGVAYHNSSLPYELREGIERAVEEKTLKVVAATTTLAEGVDLPFRVTILADWLTFDGSRSRPIESLLFRNIAGRCGRAGQFTEGDTIIFDNPVGDAQLTTPSRRYGLQQQAFFSRSQPTLLSAMGNSEKSVAVSTVGSQLLAAIRENPNLDDLPGLFYRHSFAFHSEDRSAAAERIREAYLDILDDQDGHPLAVAASPAILTAFGEAARVSGLSPTTARRLRVAIQGLSSVGVSRTDLVEVCETLLKALSDVPEQINPDLRRMGNARSRPVVRSDELGLVLDRWLAGEALDQIFASIPTNVRSKRSPTLWNWLGGISEDSTWTDQFARFSDFISSNVEFFLAWVLRAAEQLSEMDGQPNQPWSKWANFVELGVDNDWGVSLIGSGTVTDRKVAREVGQRLEALVPEGEPTLEQVQQILADTVLDDIRTTGQVLGWFRQRASAF